MLILLLNVPSYECEHQNTTYSPNFSRREKPVNIGYNPSKHTNKRCRKVKFLSNSYMFIKDTRIMHVVKIFCSFPLQIELK